MDSRRQLISCRHLTPFRVFALVLFYILTSIILMSLVNFNDTVYRLPSQKEIQSMDLPPNFAVLAPVDSADKNAVKFKPEDLLLAKDQSIDSEQKTDASDKKMHILESPHSKFDWKQAFSRDILKGNNKQLAQSDYQPLIGNWTVKFHCKTCAIVSSSGQLLNRGAGEEIDSNECVFRMNDAPTLGYENDVGYRTTARVIGHMNLKKVFKNQIEKQKEFFDNSSTKTEKLFVHWSYLTEIDKSLEEYEIGLDFARKYQKVEFIQFTPEKMKYAEKIFRYETGLTRTQARTWLSTGWYTMLLAIDACDSINVYGMVDDTYCRKHPNEKIPYHYYDLNFRTECNYYRRSEIRLTSGHLFITEKAVFGRWSKPHNITFHHPQWTPKSYFNGSLATPFLERYRIAGNRLFSRYPRLKLYFHFAGLFYTVVH
ncbi:alpha-N-acetyl-neuraminyl-2,3-beta-galactosyl-1,3-N-acetyl-galactosaminide alpha-2,6-sialyltransferase-like [Anneissia japonica]|uniref:alpha-N-acetyl-neuraminyl-2,3-beta-galactosyl-1, 3-N-acetyl-galactosaminide alpha-2,6-sialyltransferase-like n=1 Tax=Anneissia japonica TaxID=1529436 RepID=UPI0014259B4D|nr:alpha-N-acetyl-neuraminyl-2,3-beta-galactosyl-1,3-N-acetyl-galactosaminide alpha-2,6-sialyltransferase-like [Anneissia japonica]